MKKLIASILLASCVGAEAQFRRSSDSNAYPYTATLGSNYTFLIARPGVTNYNYAVSNLWISVTNIAAGEAYYATNNYGPTATNIAAYQSYLATNGFQTTVTNIAAYQAYLATNNYAGTVTNIVNVSLSFYTATNLNGNALTNINGQSVNYQTNQGSTVSIDVGNKYTGLSTNNNMSITGCANVDSTGTNISWGILTVTNSAGSGAVKTITIPAAWVDVDNLGSTTIYNTNQGVLSVMVYPGLGTNFIWRGK